MASSRGYDRETLYREVWSTPMLSLAKQYGVSDQGLRKACRKLQIPLPAVGHWAKVAAGHQIAVPPLAPFDERPVVRPHHPKLSPAVPEDLASFLEPISWPKDLHRALKGVAKRLNEALADARKLKQKHEQRQAKPKGEPNWGVLSVGSWETLVSEGYLLKATSKRFVVRTSIFQYQRALLLLSSVCKRAEDAGFKISIEGECERVTLAMAGETISMKVSEKFETTLGRKGPYSFSEQRLYHPTGVLRIHLDEFQAPSPGLTDGSKEKLESKVDLVLQALLRRYKLQTEQSAKWEERRHLAAIERRKEAAHEADLAAKQKAAEEEQRKRVALVAEAQEWERAESIRRYVAYLDRALADAGAAPKASYLDWRAWALAAAADIDKSHARLNPPDPADQSVEASVARLAAAGIFVNKP